MTGRHPSPGISANKLVVELHEMGFESEYSPARLKGGSGEEVCAVLSFLCDRALQRRGFAVREPVYPLEGCAAVARRVALPSHSLHTQRRQRSG